jgi:TonB family protein
MKAKSKFVFMAPLVSFLLLAAGAAIAKPPGYHLSSQAAEPAPYPNTTDGLHQLVMDMLDAQRTGGPEAASRYLPTLVLPENADWFSSTFGDQNGQQFAIFYDAWASFRNSQLSGDLARALAAQMTQIEVQRFDKPGDPRTAERDDYFLGLRQEPEPFYVVNFKSASGASMRWAYFVFAEDAFRYLGELPDLRMAAKAATTPEEQPSPQLTRRIRVEGNVMMAKIEHQVAPVYPPDAAAAHIEGTVLLHTIIGENGAVKELQYVSGPPQLTRAAMDAVRRWRYPPFLLNGQPVEVDTSIAVQFNLTPSSGAGAPAESALSGATEKSNPSASPGKPVVSIPSYPDSSGGLTKMMKEMLDMAKKNDNQGLEPYYQAVVLPNPDSWFAAQFGADQGAQFAQYYGIVVRSLESFFTNEIETDPNLRTSYVEVRRFKNSCDSEANDAEYPILAARVNQSTPLYEVRFTKGTGYRFLFPFVYEDGGFRYLGGLQVRAPQNHIRVPQSSGDSESGSASGVQMPKLIKEVQPTFPGGLNSRNAGVVKLWGVIGTDGSVKNLHVIEGTCDFAQATIDAVKKWRYTPLTVNGQPQEMYYPFQYSFGPGR